MLLVNPEFKKFPFIVVGTDGFYLIAENKRFLDFSGAAMTTGYDFFKSLEISSVSSLAFKNKFTLELTRRLREISGFENVAYTNSGTEACDMALSRYGRPIVSLEGAYHGRTFLTYVVSNGEGIDHENRIVHLRVPAGQALEDECTSYNELIMKRASKEFSFDGKSMIIELIQSDGGEIVLSRNFIKHLYELKNIYGLNVIMDEVYTGLGRSGELLLHKKYGLKAEMVCIGKGLAAGIPLGAILYNGKWDLPYDGALAMQAGNAAAASIALKVLDSLTEKVLKEVRKNGKAMIVRFSEIKNDHIKEVRGMGYMIGVDLSGIRRGSSKYAYRVRDELMKRGLVCTLVGGRNDVLKVTPPVLIDKKTLESGVAIIEQVLRLR
jgi:acetylornithine/N-succinyldiaminopimelate aminotransferase